MHDSFRTMAYAAVALLVAVTAYFLQPAPAKPPERDAMLREKLFPEFDDPLMARSLEIVRYNADLGEVNEFKVAEVDGSWRVVSYSNYPADATESIRDAALMLMDLKVIDVVTDLPSEHELFGVLAPDKEKLKGGEAGVGIAIKVEGEGGKDLVDLIVGKPVDKEGVVLENQRFVRKPGQDRVFVARVDLTALSSQLSDWIETDLLKLEQENIAKITIKDYAVANAKTPDGRVQPIVAHRSEMQVAHSDSKWTLGEFKTFSELGWQPASLGLDEELNQARLNNMKRSLGNLRIVGVNRKPKSLAETLKTEKAAIGGKEARDALDSVGFQVAIDPDPAGPKRGLFSSSGDLVVDMREGYRYTIRFGVPTSGQGGDSTRLNRYVFVHVKPTPGYLDPPQLAELPEVPEVKPGDAASQAKAAEVEAERKNIEKANQALKDAHQEKTTRVTREVRELNARFADWFFIIPEDVYQQVHLNRESLVQETTDAADRGFNIDAFRKLEREGLAKPPAGAPRR